MNQGFVQKPHDKMMKILLIGNPGVGKSSILLRFSDKRFNQSYCNTIGVDYRVKYLNVLKKTIKMQIWDTAGQDRFKTITSNYYRGADAIIIVYDITDRLSFESVKMWLEEIDKYSNKKTSKYIVGNKQDLPEKRAVSFEQGQQFATKVGASFKETSAKLAVNIDKVFQQIGEGTQFQKEEEVLMPTSSRTEVIESIVVANDQLKFKLRQSNKSNNRQKCCKNR